MHTPEKDETLKTKYNKLFFISTYEWEPSYCVVKKKFVNEMNPQITKCKMSRWDESMRYIVVLNLYSCPEACVLKYMCIHTGTGQMVTTTDCVYLYIYNRKLDKLAHRISQSNFFYVCKPFTIY